MKKLCFFLILITTSAFAFAPNPSLTRQKSMGTKGYACFSTVNKDGILCRTATTAGVATVSKWYINGDSTKVYPTSEQQIDLKKRTTTSACMAAYSSASELNAHCWGE